MKQLQPHHDPSRTVAAVGGFCLVAGVLTMGLGMALDGGPHSVARYAFIAGLIVACLGFFVGLGFWAQHAHARRALAEMEAGAVLGDWPSERGRVQVGSRLAIVDGKVRGYGLFLQAVTGVSVDPSGALVVRAAADSGYGPGAFEVRLPGSADRDETERCARALAAHHAVSVAPPD
ncbi:MAG: hypothetical protein AAFU79_04560 [Myxococcota bacterium]